MTFIEVMQVLGMLITVLACVVLPIAVAHMIISDIRLERRRKEFHRQQSDVIQGRQANQPGRRIY